jgi:hypothetical protein
VIVIASVLLVAFAVSLPVAAVIAGVALLCHGEGDGE